MSERLIQRLMLARARRGWLSGNQVELLENGEEYFPAVYEAIAQAQKSVIVETFILFEDKVGLALQEVLIAAAQRGVSVDVLVDGFGSPDLSDEYIGALTRAGVRLRAFDPRPPLFGRLRINVFRRMHRKIVVVDGEVAFVGGINFSADHLADFGPEAKQDYSVRLKGPIVARIHAFARKQVRPHARAIPLHPVPQPAGDAQAMFIVRDNRRHRDDIERHYRAAIRTARSEVLIANAYFFPGYRLLKALRNAARRGVRVRLILQGQPDMPIVKIAAGLLHSYLLPAGVEIYEYCKRPLHSKVALVDDLWATVGSSNLDPLSLSLNLEANVVTRDRAFNQELRTHLERLIAEHCLRVDAQVSARRSRWYGWLDALAYHLTRRFPAWAGWLPAHQERFAPLEPSQVADESGAERTNTNQGETHA